MLGKPTPEFFINHLKFIFDESRGMMWGIFLVSCFSFVVFFKRPDKFQLLAFLLWILPMAIGYYYSVTKNPVLQDSVLLFGFPFLLMFLFSLIPDFNFKKNAIVFPIGFSLVFLFYITIYKPFHLTDHFGKLKELVANTIGWQKKYANEKVDVAYNVDADYFVDYYYNRFGEKRKNILTTRNNGKEELLAFRKLVANSTADYFVYGWSTKYSPLEIFPIVEERFPYLIEKHEWFNSAVCLFSKCKNANSIDEKNVIIFESGYDFWPLSISSKERDDSLKKLSPQVNWNYSCRILSIDSNDCNISAKNSRRIRLDSACVYSPLLKMNVGDILKNPDNTILFSTNIKLLNKNSDVILVIQFERDGKKLYWNGIESTTQIDTTKINEWQNVYFGIQLPNDLKRSDTVSFYCYSKNGLPLLLDYLDVKTLKGHPGIYGPRPDFQ